MWNRYPFDPVELGDELKDKIFIAALNFHLDGSDLDGNCCAISIRKDISPNSPLLHMNIKTPPLPRTEIEHGSEVGLPFPE